MPEFKDDRRLPYQIQPELDDFGLDPYQFRVYCRVVRRARKGDCHESVRNMADGCKMSTGKVKECLKWLIDHGFIIRESQVGKPSRYTLTDLSHWENSNPRPSHVATQVPGHETTQPHDNPGRRMAGGGHVATQVPGHEVATKINNKNKQEKIEGSPPVEFASHPVALQEEWFRSGGQSSLPWVVSSNGRFQHEYDASMLEAVIEHLKTTPSFEKKVPTYADAKKWLSTCHFPANANFEKRTTDAYIVWESAQNRKEKAVQTEKEQQQSDAEREAILSHLNRGFLAKRRKAS